MTRDVVDRLRAMADTAADSRLEWDVNDVLRDAADEIERLRDAIVAAKAAAAEVDRAAAHLATTETAFLCRTGTVTHERYREAMAAHAAAQTALDAAWTRAYALVP